MQCAVKIVKQPSSHGERGAALKGPAIRIDPSKEGRILARVQHANVVRVQEVLNLRTLCCTALELLGHGDLHAVMKTNGRFSDEAMIRIARDVATGLAFMHGLGIVHRDITPKNIVFANAALTSVKIIDFGLAIEVGEDGRIPPLAVGNGGFAAPEMHRDGWCRNSVDIYAFGSTVAACHAEVKSISELGKNGRTVVMITNGSETGETEHLQLNGDGLPAVQCSTRVVGSGAATGWRHAPKCCVSIAA
ncbi:kinase-like protein [Auricularia subglabra TFB-10046 SS5]|uniref:Kinase-like protein n=1 Tax=Auricularia subglabra (strain TFB-10046 / SS5) TaxID=717982 RepID=J0WQ21_AURST|nr:kinase-like protein [Auricularia subglabra TFB-10046 SS5]